MELAEHVERARYAAALRLAVAPDQQAGPST